MEQEESLISAFVKAHRARLAREMSRESDSERAVLGKSDAGHADAERLLRDLGHDFLEQLRPHLRWSEGGNGGEESGPGGGLIPQLAAVFENLVDGVVIADREGRFVYWNPSSVRMRGFVCDGELKRPFGELREMFRMSRPDGEELEDEEWPISRLMRGETVRNLECRVLRRDTGEEWSVLYNGNRVRDPESGEELLVLLLHDLTEQRKMRGELDRTVRLLEAIHESSSSGLLIKDRSGKYLYSNRASAGFVGLSSRDLVGRYDHELLGEESYRTVREQDQEVLESGRTVSREYELTSGGVTRLHVGTKLPLRDDHEKIVGVVGIIEDVTERRRAEQELRESEGRFRELADAIPQIVWVAGPDGAIETLNRRAEEFTGLRVEELGGWNWGRAIHPEDLPRVLEEWREIRETRIPRPLQFRIRNQAGEYRWHITREMPIRNEQGHVLRWYGTCTDIHDQVLAEEQLRNSEERFRTFVENAVDSLFIHGEDGRVLDVNEQACLNLGYSREELLGKRPPDFDCEISEEELSRLSALLESGENLIFESRHRRKDGSEFPVEVHLSGFRNGGELQSIASVHDISQRHATDRALKESEERYRLALDAAQLGTWRHDLKTDLLTLDERAREHHGVSESVMPISELEKLLFPEDWGRVQGHMAAVVRGEEMEIRGIELRIRAPGGKTRWLSVSAQVHGSSEGGAEFVIGTTLDITARKESEEKVQRSESLLRTVIDNANGAVWVKDAEGRYAVLNRYVENLFRCPETEFLGKTVHEVFPTDEAEAYEANDRQVLESGETLTVEETARIGDRTLTFLSVKFPLKDVTGNVMSLGAICTDITAQKEMEAALRERETRLKAFVENAGDAFSLHERYGRILDVNAQACESLGYEREEILGRPCGDFDVGVAREFIVNEVVPRLDRGETVTYESRNRRKDGSEFPTEVRLRPFWSDGVRYSMALTRDISERKRMEAALRESDIRLRTLVDHASDGFFLRKRGGEILDVNRTACESLGYEREELIGRQLHEYIVGLTNENYSDVVSRLDAGETVTQEAAHRRKDGGTFPVEIRIRPFWVDGERYSVSLVRDITERLRAAAELRSKQLFIQRIADASPHVFYVFDVLRGDVVYTNRQTALDLGFRDEELSRLSGNGFLELMHPDDLKRLPELLARWDRAEDGEILETEYRLRDVKGDWHWFVGRDTVFTRTKDGLVEQIIGTAQDITERRVLEAQLRQSQKMEAIGQLAGGVAHDFNNLLTVVNGYCDLLLMDEKISGVRRGQVAAIRDAGVSAAALTQQLLAFSRRAIVNPREFDLNALVSKSEVMLRPLIGEQIQLTTILSAEVLETRADPHQIEQVILNLALNARDAMPEGGRLTIRTNGVQIDESNREEFAGMPEGAYVQIRISDTGSGMSEEVLSRIFEPFFTTKEVGKGTGLGLAVAHGIITQCGGFIDAKSQMGMGTSFRILLPAIKDSTRKKGETSKGRVHGVGTVLLIEDEEGVRGIVKLALETHGYRVLAAGGAEEAEAIEREAGDEIDIIVTDVVMPGLNGRQVVDRIRERHPERPVLYISGYTDDEVVKRGVAASRDAFLQKPFTPAVLTRKVHELLQGRE